MTTPAWAQAAIDRGLKPGNKARMDHDCGEGKTLLVSHDGDRLRAFCFRCKESLKPWFLQLTVAERAKLLSERVTAVAEAGQSLELPGREDERLLHPHDWPAAARVWLYDAGLNDDIIRDWGIYWYPRMARVVVPIEQGGGTEAWLARSVDKTQQPKYLFPAGMKRNRGAYLHSCSATHDAVVVVEDVLSAYRISEAGPFSAVALLGTSADQQLLIDLRNEADEYGVRVVTWLDGDSWGQRGALDIRNRLARYDIAVSNVLTGKDPKTYTDNEIRGFIHDALT